MLLTQPWQSKRNLHITLLYLCYRIGLPEVVESNTELLVDICAGWQGV